MPLTGRPDVVDNVEVSHAEALTYILDDLDAKHALSVATGYVNLGGLQLLAETARGQRSTRLMLGASPNPGLDAEPPALRFGEQLEIMRGERDFARFPPSRAAIMLALVDAHLARADVEVRRYTKTFLHGKAYLLGDAQDGRAAMVTSANLTWSGLRRNLELGLVDYGPENARRAITWFDRLWAESVDYKAELRGLLFPALPTVTPSDVYLRALLELYGQELFDTDTSVAPVDSHVTLAPFQRDGYQRARVKLEAHHGVVYADGVGTGKTEIGLALIEEYALRQGRHALVVCPAQLRGMWLKRIAAARLPAEVVSFQELAGDEQLADPDRASGRRLRVAKDAYRLVLVDEAHALRNAGNTWYRAMTRLLGGEQKDLVLLSATPINNTLWDLFNLVMLFGRHDRALAPVGIDSIRAEFLAAGANERDAANLDPDRLFSLADAVSVRRDRAFIVERYGDTTFPDGTPLRFPVPRLTTRRYDLDASSPGLVRAVADQVGALSMARYRPSAYERGGGQRSSEVTLAGLLQSAVLKRFESCWAACLATVERMIAAHEAFLAAWDGGSVPSLTALREAAHLESGEADLASWLDEVSADEQVRSVDDFEPSYRDDVQADLTRLQGVAAALRRVTPTDDPKLQVLAAVLRDTPGKVCVFATYGETVGYLDRHLDAALGVARERVVIIGGETDPDERTARLARLCPETVVEPGYRPPDGEVDLLLSTDVVAEGQNLQQAATVVSYDMPWNPQRVVQRNGRVIRLRSPHTEVSLVTMLPEPGDLELLLGLEARIAAKIAAAGVFGMESGVLSDADVTNRIYAELTDFAERLVDGDASLLSEGEEAGGAFEGERLRALLLRAGVEGEVARLSSLPWGVGAAFRRGSSQLHGWFFACRTPPTAGDRRYWRFVTGAGAVIRDELPMLRAIDPVDEAGIDAGEGLEDAWLTASTDIVAEHNERSDPALAQERLPPSQRFALALLSDPAVALPPGAGDAYDLLSVSRDTAVKRALTDVQRRLTDREVSRDSAAEAIVSIVAEFGLTPVQPLPLLDPITVDDIGVVCWMRVLP